MSVPRLRMLAAIAGAAALASIALVLVASGGNSALAASSVVNGNFETGDLSGWTVDTTASGGNASAVTGYDWYRRVDCSPEGSYGGPCYTPATMPPKEGSYFALLQSGKASEYTTMISQPFTVSKGDKVSGWAFFYTESWQPNDDKVQVLVKSASGTTVAKPFEESVYSSVDHYNSGWKYWEHPFMEEGEFQIEARIGSGDYWPWAPNSMGLDDVKTGMNDAPADTTKPSTSATRSVEPNALGWNKEDVTVKLKATDNQGGWGVKEITYRINGGEPTTEVGDSVEVPVKDEGETTIAYYATDKALNLEDEQSLQVKVDKTPPKVDSTSPARDATGLSPPAKISVTFLESGSGIDPSTLTPNGFVVYKQVYDRRGELVGSEQVSGTISCDKPCKTATFTPRSKLTKGTYKVYINGGYVEDKADNHLLINDDYNPWSFSVG